MNILYIHQHFAIPTGATGTRSYEFSRRWVEAGHRVTIITGKYDIGGLKTSSKLVERMTVDGIDVVVVGMSYSNKQSFLSRVWSFFVFMTLACFIGLRQKAVDIVYATSTPLTVGIPALLIKCLRRIPYVFEVRDQWPQVPIELGLIKNTLLKRFLLGLEKTIYKNASAIVALSPGMADGIKTVLGKIQKNVTVIPNCCDTDLFKPQVDGSSIRKQRGWADKFVLIHAGAMGKANGLDFVIEIAGCLKENRSILFVLLGDGSERARLIEKANSASLRNIEFTGSIPKDQLPQFLAAADAAMAIFADYPILQHNSANKFFDALSAGKPILLNYSGWQRNTVEKRNAGFGCPQGDTQLFARHVLTLYNDRELVKQMGNNARQLAVEQFDRTKLAANALAVLELSHKKDFNG